VQLRAIMGIGLAIAFPIGSMIGIQQGSFNLAWLSLPDVLISLALLQGLRGDARYGMLLTGFSLTLTLSLINPELSPLFPGLIFLLISRYFHQSLAPHQTPLITQMARRIRGPDAPFSNDALAYTTRLTRAWSFLFICLGACQAILVFTTPGPWPWMMGNTLAPALIFLFLLIEPFYRRYRLPNEPRHSLRHFFTRLAETDWKRMN
jgi:uncharacterized membrane protein